MLPTDQGFRTNDLTRAKIDLGLVQQAEHVMRDRMAQSILHRQPFLNLAVHVARIKLVTIAAKFLGAVHGGIRIAQQVSVSVPSTG